MKVGTKIESIGNFLFADHSRPSKKSWRIRKGDKGQIVESTDAIYVHPVLATDAIFVRFGWDVFALDANQINSYVRIRDMIG
ncbi:hypothetical protein P9274_20120 [Schinkia azotoformans]|uniref:hypothetical protein n=1 Tax=Schinkia azotoformans TaxID=1454 RepID=UPI002E24134B|nr:hypothetical protein [Schinkia azotoformans]